MRGEITIHFYRAQSTVFFFLLYPGQVFFNRSVYFPLFFYFLSFFFFFFLFLGSRVKTWEDGCEALFFFFFFLLRRLRGFAGVLWLQGLNAPYLDDARKVELSCSVSEWMGIS